MTRLNLVCGKYRSGKSTLLQKITGNGAYYSGKCCKTTTIGMIIDGPYYANDIINRIKSKPFLKSIKNDLKQNTAIFFIDSQGIGDKESQCYSEIMRRYFSFFCALSDVCINISEMDEICDFFNEILNTIRGGQLMRIKFSSNISNQDDKDINKQFTKIIFLGRSYEELNREIKTKKEFKSIQQDYEKNWNLQHKNAYECYDPKLLRTFPLGNIKSSPFTYNASVWNIIPEIFNLLNNSIDYTKSCIINKIKDAMIFIFSDFFKKFKQMDNEIDKQIEFIANFSLQFVNNIISQYQDQKISKTSAINSIDQFLNIIVSMIIPYTIGQNVNLSSQDCNQYSYDLMKDIISYLRKNIPTLEANLFNSIYELYQRDILIYSFAKRFIYVQNISANFIEGADYFTHDGTISKGLHYITNVFRYFEKKNIIKQITSEKIGTSIPFLWNKIECDNKSSNIKLITNSKKFLSKYKKYEFIIVLENNQSTFMKFIIQCMTGIKCDFEAENKEKETILYGPFSPDYLVNRISRCFPEHISLISSKEIYILYLRDYNENELNQLSEIQEKALFCLSSNESIGAYPPIKEKLFYMFNFVQKPEIKLLKKKDCDEIQINLNLNISKNGYNIIYLPIIMENSKRFDKIGPQTNKNLRWAFHQIFKVKKL